MSSPAITSLPSPEPQDGLDAILRAIEGLAASLTEARTRIEAGEPTDLTGLDQRVRAICGAVGRLDDATGRTLLAPLTALGEGLDALDAVLKRRRQECDRTSPAPSPQRAAGAYGAARDRTH
jgi:hypothetical protein